jgi:uncharacterized protein (TIGR00299 family) protein
MNILYLDPVLGISGDMTISALIDAGCPLSVLTDLLGRLPVSVPSMSTEEKRHGTIAGRRLIIGPSDIRLSVTQMRQMIERLDAEERVKADAAAILDIIVNAESKVHGVPKEDIHFHELSHIDTIIDVLCAARAIAYFKIDKVFCGPVPVGRGFVKTAHGIMPNPPPATTELLSGFKVVFLDEELELTTPTGAAIVRHYAKSQTAPAFRIVRHGCGFGAYETARPNALRVFIGEMDAPDFDEEIWVMEADMDDMESEYIGAAAERIRLEGALDVLCFPVQMKKGRSGMRLSILSPSSRISAISDAVFRETSTFGLRLRPEFRTILARSEEVRPTSFGPVRVKKGYDRSGKLVKTHIEFEEVKRIADERGMPYRSLLDALKKEL